MNNKQTKNPKEKPTKSGLKRNEQWVEMNSGKYDGARVPKYY